MNENKNNRVSDQIIKAEMDSRGINLEYRNNDQYFGSQMND